MKSRKYVVANSCKFGQALQKVFAKFFLIIFSLIKAFLKAIKCFDTTTVSASKVKSNRYRKICII